MNVSEQERARNRAEHAAVAERATAAQEAVPVGTVTGPWRWTVPFLLIGGFFGAIWLGGALLPARSAPAPLALSQASSTDIQSGCEAMISRKLDTPSTARFPRAGTPDYVDDRWIYSDVVDAQNTFGAMVRRQFICTVTGATVAAGKVRAGFTP